MAVIGAPEDPEVGLGRQRLLGVVLHVDVDAAPARRPRVDEKPPTSVGAWVPLAAVEAVEVLRAQRGFPYRFASTCGGIPRR